MMRSTLVRHRMLSTPATSLLVALFLLSTALPLRSTVTVAAFHASSSSTRRRQHESCSSHTQLGMAARNRGGLEQRREGATPTEGGMTLYVKAGPDGTSLGDCPFSHFVGMVLQIKGLTYDLVPATSDTKPNWLVEHYDGKMPALRHRKECYVESDTIAAYLDFFFENPVLTPPAAELEAAEAATEGLFKRTAAYLKHSEDHTDADEKKRQAVQEVLAKLNEHLGAASRSSGTGGGPYVCGDGSAITLMDCKLAPVLYHLCTGIEAFKNGAIDIASDYPKVADYTEHMFQHAAFLASAYPKEVVTWGWGNARASSSS